MDNLTKTRAERIIENKENAEDIAVKLIESLDAICELVTATPFIDNDKLICFYVDGNGYVRFGIPDTGFEVRRFSYVDDLVLEHTFKEALMPGPKSGE